MLTLAYGCGLRASEVVRLRAGDIDSEQMIIRIVQSKGQLLSWCPTSRDFVPWRSLDAGQVSLRSLLVAGVQKPTLNAKNST